MLIDDLISEPDFSEVHQVVIEARPEAVYQMLWTTDLGGSPIIKGLLGLRSLPHRLIHPAGQKSKARKITLATIVANGFGVLAEDSGREIVLGVAGPFWRPQATCCRLMRKTFAATSLPGWRAPFGTLQCRTRAAVGPFW